MARLFANFAHTLSRARTTSSEGLVDTERERQANSQITRRLESEANKDRNVHKILMLGAGESGKSTILKMLLFSFFHDKNYPKAELLKSRDAIQGNIIDILVNTSKQARVFGYELSEPVNRFLQHFDNYHRDDALQLDVHEMRLVLSVAEDIGIIETLERANEWQLTLMDNFEYFIRHRERILAQDYEPSFEDVIRSRQRTTGLTSHLFSYMSKNGRTTQYRITDVGGQQTERRKWINVFDDVTLVIFVCALSGYNQKVFENESRNRLVESIDLFDAALSKPALANKNCIVFFNKHDIFREKIQEIPFNVFGHFDDYDGGQHDGEAVKEYLEKRFSELNRSRHRLLYFHATNATNVENIEYVFAAVHDTITRDALKYASLI